MFNFGSGMLTGAEIERQIKKGNIQISPYDPECINPNSYNLKLHPQLLIYKRDSLRENVVPYIGKQTIIAGDNSQNISLSKCQYSDSVKDSYNEIAHNPDNAEELSEGGRKLLDACADSEPELVSINANSSDIEAVGPSRVHFSNKLDDIEKSILNTEEKIKSDMDLLSKGFDDRFDAFSKLSNVDSAMLPPIDMMKPNETIEFEIPEEGYVLQPGVLYIGRTVETTFTDKYIPMINGRSSGGRLGISIHICAGFGDIGFDGTWTLEITCVEPVRIYPNVPIAQVCYFKPCGKVRDLYMGRYHGQKDATASRFYK